MYSRMCSNRCKGNQMHTTNMTTHVPIYKVRACVHDSDHMISACRTSSLPLYIIIVFGTLTQKKHIHNYTDTQVIPITHRVNAKLRLLICHQAYCPGWSNRILRCVFFFMFFMFFCRASCLPKRRTDPICTVFELKHFLVPFRRRRFLQRPCKILLDKLWSI